MPSSMPGSMLKPISLLHAACCGVILAGVVGGMVVGAEPVAEEASRPLSVETNSLGMRLRLIPAGEFMQGEMHGDLLRKNHPFSTGSTGSHSERPAHPVRLTRPFWMAECEVTVGQFGKFVAATGYRTTAETSGQGAGALVADAEEEIEQFVVQPERNWRSPGFAQTDRHPVVCISWKDAVAFCDWLGRQEKADYRLPTEAEWEYAARAGSTTSYLGGDLADTIYSFGNVADAALEAAHPGMVLRQRVARLGEGEGDGHVYTAPTGSLQANRWGLFDTHGNVWEWCSDKYYDRYYTELSGMSAMSKVSSKAPPSVDPAGPDTTPNHAYGDWRSLRGGAWCSSPVSSRSASRSFGEASEAYSYTGFRVVRSEE
ncbi:formylglycine-generating enzyme family protein [Lignipirellula cremea]|uniref:Serine/threonine-protein kinase pkn1 n=1 Tax=Lignipirellula cremea TaxID=2528010 RepID=A0A518DMF3_9BACT|nr:formylglycine-generating enzyme family protein [Lignipirellula cremea]QDU93018.1 Serine/threonine-protein kinase pkn1 [Lignipirellula cremea]